MKQWCRVDGGVEGVDKAREDPVECKKKPPKNKINK